MSCVLHNDNVHRLVLVGPKSKNSIYSGDETLIICVFDVLDKCIHHVEKLVPFLALKCFDEESVVIAEKEETATPASSLSSSEDHLVIFDNGKRLHDLMLCQAIGIYDILELFFKV